MNIAAVVLIGSLVYTLTNLWKMLQAKSWDGVKNQVAAYVIGVGVVFLASAAAVTGSYDINGIALNNYDWQSKLVFGLLASSLFGAFNDLTAAVDQSRSSKAVS